MPFTKIYHSEHNAECDDTLSSMLFETECEYALSEGYSHVMDFAERMFTLSKSDDGIINLVEIEVLKHTNTDEQTEEDYICNACASLEALDAAILAHLTNTKSFNNDTANTLLKLAEAKHILVVAHNA